MAQSASLLSLAAAALYSLVFLACLLASWTSVLHRQQKWHRWTWLVCAALFIGLIVFRVLGLEDLIRESLREALKASGRYSNRGTFQRPVIASAVILSCALGVYFSARFLRGLRGRRNLAVAAGAIGACAMAFLLCLRLISLHVVDRLLYGPLKLNWFADLGLAIGTLGAAVAYILVIKSAQDGRWNSRGGT